jgi:hypothetical protein
MLKTTVEDLRNFMANLECLIIELRTLRNLEILTYVKTWEQFDIRNSYCHVFMVVTNNNVFRLDDFIY